MRAKVPNTKLIDLFLDMLAAEQGAGENTLQAYRRDLTDFSEFCARSGQSVARVGTEKLRDYLDDLDTRGFKSSSVARRLSAIRHLFRFLLNERIRGDDPAAILSAPKRGRGLLEVLYATGMRVSELVSLPRSAARNDARMIVVRGKGNKERLVPLNDASRTAMSDYLAATEATKSAKAKGATVSKWLFPSFGESGHLTRQH